MNETSSRRRLLFLGGAIVVVFVLHAAQIVAPPLVTPDALSYARIAEAQAAGQGLRPSGVFNRWPPGYPLALSVLIRAGIASSATFLALNLVAMAGGLVAAASLLRREALTREETALAVLLTLLSLPALYTVPPAQSDCLAFGLCLAALLTLDRADRAPAGRAFITAASAGAILVVLTILVRMVGVTLLPALAWIVVRRADRRWIRPARLVALAILVILAGVALDRWVLRTGYLAEAIGKVQRRLGRPGHGIAEGLAAILKGHLRGWGVVALNLRSSRIPWHGTTIAVVAGVGLLGLGGRALLRRRRVDPVAIFVATYAGVLMVFPAFSPTYWLPIAPFIAGLFAALPARAPGVAGKAAVGVYLTIWSVLGGEVLVRRAVENLQRGSAPARTSRSIRYQELESYRQKYDITRRR